MTAEQYGRWREFALAMARGGWAGMTGARRARLAREVERWFAVLGPEDWAAMRSWDESDGESRGQILACDLFHEVFDGYLVERAGDGGDVERACARSRFHDQLACCVRAGMDVAAEPSAGVLGFTVGDVRRMFGGAVPAWVAEKFTGLGAAPDVEGIWL